MNGHAVASMLALTYIAQCNPMLSQNLGIEVKVHMYIKVHVCNFSKSKIVPLDNSTYMYM